MSFKLSASTVTRKDIMPISVSKNQKTNISLGNLYAGDWN